MSKKSKALEAAPGKWQMLAGLAAKIDHLANNAEEVMFQFEGDRPMFKLLDCQIETLRAVARIQKAAVEAVSTVYEQTNGDENQC